MRSPSRLPLSSRTDLFELMAISVLGPVAWLTPERAWLPIGHLLSLAIARLWPGVTRTRVATLARALGARRADHDLRELRVAILDAYMEERMQILRAHRPGGWRPHLQLVGRVHLDEALAAARGAVLWMSPFSYGDLVAKMALHEAGIAVTHVSVFSRGFSPNSCFAPRPTRFGRRVLSPLRTRIEDRYLRERLAIAPDGSLAYARHLERRARANAVVSLRAGDAGHRAIEVPFLAGSIRLATGAPSLALASGAALLPVFTVRAGPGAFAVVVEPPLAAAERGERHERVDDLTHRYAHLLERYVHRHPELWSGWYSMRLEAHDATAQGAPTTQPAMSRGGAVADGAR